MTINNKVWGNIGPHYQTIPKEWVTHSWHWACLFIHSFLYCSLVFGKVVSVCIQNEMYISEESKLTSTNERLYTMIVFFLFYSTQHDCLQLYPFSCTIILISRNSQVLQT